MDQSKTFRPDLITRPAFIVSVAILIVNDFYLKYALSNYLTGKLSDFAGLFAFSYFLACFRVNWCKPIYITTALLFAIWKSKLSDPLLVFMQSLGIGVSRVPDHSDLFAILILPISFIYFNRQLKEEASWQRASTLFVFAVSIFAFCATTVLRQPIPVRLDSNKEYNLSMTKQQLFQKLTPGFSFSDTLSKNLQDSLFYISFHVTDSRASIKTLTVITEDKNNTVSIKLDSVLMGYMGGRLFGNVPKSDLDKFKALSIEDFEKYFEAIVVDGNKTDKAKHVTYDNKLLVDSFRMNRAR